MSATNEDKGTRLELVPGRSYFFVGPALVFLLLPDYVITCGVYHVAKPHFPIMKIRTTYLTWNTLTVRRASNDLRCLREHKLEGCTTCVSMNLFIISKREDVGIRVPVLEVLFSLVAEPDNKGTDVPPDSTNWFAGGTLSLKSSRSPESCRTVAKALM